MMKEMRGEDSVEAETGMANNHFLVAWHYAQRQRTRERKTENIKEIDENTSYREERRT